MTKWLEKFGKHLQKVTQDMHKPKRRRSRRRSRSRSCDVAPAAVQAPVPAPLTANEKFMKKVAQNSILLAVAWALLLFTLLFFGIQWRSVNARLANIEALLRDGFGISNSMAEARIKDLLSRCAEKACDAQEVLQQLQNIVEK